MRIMYSEIRGNHEIQSDGFTVWVNSNKGCCVGRFAWGGIDIHHDTEAQMQLGKQCLDCKKGPTTLEDWEHFRSGMRDHFGVEIHEKHMPDFLKRAIAA